MKPYDKYPKEPLKPILKETEKPSRKMRKRKFKRSNLTTRGVKTVAATAFVFGLLIGYTAAPSKAITSATPPQPAVGLVAYHTNDYQLHAINLLMQRNQVEQWSCLWALWTAESNWRSAAHNKSSGAYGIAQFMPATWKNVGYEKTSDGFIQVQAGLAYIDHRYAGSPCKAYAHFLAKRWY